MGAVLLPSLSVFAQEMIRLKEDTFLIENRNFNVVSVVDARPDASRVGFLHVGDANRERVALMEGGLTESTKAFLHQSLVELPNAYPILLRITRFGIGEEGRPIDRTNYLVADFEFYLASDSGSYQIFTQHHWIQYNGRAANQHEYYIRVALRKSLRDLAASNWKDRLKELPRWSSEAVTQTALPPILLTDAYAKGIYRTFDEYRNNQPSPVQISWTEKPNGIVKLYYMSEKGKWSQAKSGDNFWGFSDGTRTFIKQNAHYTELRKNRKGVYFSGVNRAKVQRNAAKGGVLGGLVGGVVAASFTNRTGVYVLDLETGASVYVR